MFLFHRSMYEMMFLNYIFNAQLFSYSIFWENCTLWNFYYMTNRWVARMWRHKMKTLKLHNSFILWSIFTKLLSICFFYCSAFIKTNLISGWTLPLTGTRYWIPSLTKKSMYTYKYITPYFKKNITNTVT